MVWLRRAVIVVSNHYENTLWPVQNERHFLDDISICILITSKPALIQQLAWSYFNKWLPISLSQHITSRPHWIHPTTFATYFSYVDKIRIARLFGAFIISIVSRTFQLIHHVLSFCVENVLSRAFPVYLDISEICRIQFTTIIPYNYQRQFTRTS